MALVRLRPERPAYTAIVEAMLAAHADPEVAWGQGPSKSGGYSEQVTMPILEAQFRNVPAAARALMAAGLAPRSREAETALVDACENREAELARVLIEAGVPINTPHAASTPLVAAIGARDVALMTYLEAHGAREKP
jgi:ankyrin repeat protein